MSKQREALEMALEALESEHLQKRGGSMIKYTPGPWAVRERGFSLQITYHRTKKISFRLADLHWWSGKPHFPGKAEAIANAKLMAAAPDLLEALEELLYARTDKAEKMAQDAIAKARYGCGIIPETLAPELPTAKEAK